jgi:hypothetical protein
MLPFPDREREPQGLGPKKTTPKTLEGNEIVQKKFLLTELSLPA